MLLAGRRGCQIHVQHPRPQERTKLARGRTSIAAGNRYHDDIDSVQYRLWRGQQRSPCIFAALFELAAASRVFLHDIVSDNTFHTGALEAARHLGPDFPKADKA